VTSLEMERKMKRTSFKNKTDKPYYRSRRSVDREFGQKSVKLVLKRLRGEISIQEFERNLQTLETDLLPLFQSAVV